MPIAILHSPRISRARRGYGALLLLPLLLGGAAPAAAPVHPPQKPPFATGETFNYRVRLGRLGTVGRGTMRVVGPTQVRGRDAVLLTFQVRARVGFATVRDSSRSWVDADRLTTLRYYKHENSPLGRGVESVEVYPEEHRWTGADGSSGETPCASPLDELSFLYYLRTLPLEDGDSYRLEHHFDAGRNPVLVKVLRRESWTGPVASGPVVVVEMRVKDPKHFGGDGALLITFTDDEQRIPVQLESRVPVFGRMTLTLESLQP